jgi:hypothetical protein
MPQMTPSQARVIDPILTEVARGFRSNNSPVANLLFPIVSVGQRGGRIISFGADDFKLYNTARAPGANTRRVQFGYSSGSFALVDYSLEGSVPIELLQEAQAVPGIDLSANAVRKVQNLQALEREKQVADLALNAASYAASNKATLSGTSQWNDASSNPFADLLAAKEAVRQQIGQRPNTLVLGPKVLTALRSNPKVLDRLSTASDRPPATLAQLAALFEVPSIVEGGMTYHDGTNFVDVWGRYALLAYTDTASAAEMGSPNFGYTYQLTEMPVVEESYYDRNAKTWYFPVTDARQPVLVGPSAGFLFTNAVA